MVVILVKSKGLDEEVVGRQTVGFVGWCDPVGLPNMRSGWAWKQ